MCFCKSYSRIIFVSRMAARSWSEASYSYWRNGNTTFRWVEWHNNRWRPCGRGTWTALREIISVAGIAHRMSTGTNSTSRLVRVLHRKIDGFGAWAHDVIGYMPCMMTFNPSELFSLWPCCAVPCRAVYRWWVDYWSSTTKWFTSICWHLKFLSR